MSRLRVGIAEASQDLSRWKHGRGITIVRRNQVGPRMWDSRADSEIGQVTNRRNGAEKLQECPPEGDQGRHKNGKVGAHEQSQA